MDQQPIEEGHVNEDQGVSPPMREDDAENNELQPQSGGQLHKKHNQDKDEDEGKFQPAKARNDNGGKFQPAHDDAEYGALRPTIGDLSNGEFFPHFVDYLLVDEMHNWKQLLFTYVYVAIRGLGMAHDYHIITFAKTQVDPKVKKKTSLLLCLSIDMPFYPSEHGHDGITPSRHHEPCSSPCLYIECSGPTNPHSPPPPSSSDFSFLIILSNEDTNAYEVLEAATVLSIELPFIPLRGSKRCQAHERNFKLENPHAALKTKTMVMKMPLFYINKDLLDPG